MISKSYGYKENRHLYSLCILYKMNKIHLERFKIGYLFLTYISYEYQRQFGWLLKRFLAKEIIVFCEVSSPKNGHDF